MSLLRDTIAAVRALPGWIADGCDRWLMRLHEPIEDWPEDPAPCLGCRKPWPCEDFMQAADRLTERHEAHP